MNCTKCKFAKWGYWQTLENTHGMPGPKTIRVRQGKCNWAADLPIWALNALSLSGNGYRNIEHIEGEQPYYGCPAFLEE